jgi:hypothetical protein
MNNRTLIERLRAPIGDFTEMVTTVANDDPSAPIFDPLRLEAAAALTALEQDNAKLREATMKLCNEVSGLEAFERGVREWIGNTNWAVLMLRLNEANNAMKAPETLDLSTTDAILERESEQDKSNVDEVRCPHCGRISCGCAEGL